MEYVDIVISTRKRLDKLLRTIKSIPERTDLNLKIIFDGDFETFTEFVEMDNKKPIWKGGGFKANCLPSCGSVYCRNHVIRKCEDAVLYATDDIVFQENSIESAIYSLQTEFPDDDGVIGFNQFNLYQNFCWTGVALVGQKFLQRYPKKVLFYPGYFHFGTREIETHSMKLGKLFNDIQARLFHFHPDFYREEMDETHKEARKFKKRDMDLKKLRQEKGLIWGYNDKNCQQFG